MVTNGDIVSTMDNLAMVNIADQSHMDQLIATIRQLTDTNKILGQQLNNFLKQTIFWIGKFKKIKRQPTKIIVTLQNFTQTDIVGLVGGGSQRVTAEYHVRQRRMDIRMDPQGQKNCKDS